jgi:hypothetical protein
MRAGGRAITTAKIPITASAERDMSSVSAMNLTRAEEGE